MDTEIKIVNRGRGLQLSTSRVTVQDLVPYFQEGCSHANIMRWIPTLTAEEIAVVERFYLSHRSELDDEDHGIRERIVERRNPPEVEKLIRSGRDKLEALRHQLLKGTGNGEPP